MMDQILGFVVKHKAATAVAAVLGGLALYAANDRAPSAPTAQGFRGETPGGPVTPVSTGGGHEVIDRAGFDRPVRALTIPVPQGWSAESEIRWDNVNGQCSAGVASPHIRMTSPDRREQIEILPGFIITNSAQMITNRGVQPGDFCIIGMAASGEELARGFAVPRLRQGARIDRIVNAPLTPELQSAQAQFDQMRRSQSSNVQANVYSLEVWLTHNDGTVEVLLINGYVFHTPSPVAGVPPSSFNQNGSIISVRAAPDRIGGLLETTRGLVAAIQFNPEWKSALEETQRVVSAPVSPRGGGGSRGGSGGGGSGGGFDMDRWRDDQRRDDRQQRDRIDSIREVERCYDPETGRSYEVSIHVGC